MVVGWKEGGDGGGVGGGGAVGWWFIIFADNWMKTGGNSRLNREEQVKVVIRLKPEDAESRAAKCVYLSERENELVVETGNKKEIFVFDHVAHQLASQIDIYRMIGEEAVQTTLEGYNCCIFAYGQTGAGKTYSVMGCLPDLTADHYAHSRGLLPRLIEDVFAYIKSHDSEKHSIVCSYMEIYNEQIFDLLSPDKRIHQIREDFKRGVFVEGLTEKKVTSYRQGVEMLLEGEKTRKMASTAMNTESSRSHAIFTVNVESEIMEDDVLKIRKSKINIVDLAGSERVKHTHVEGERLKEGCNINKSLHVLGNVINSLVESAKKKKHIPFRDSKLTHYLKDSLGGNSITKLLANVHCGKQYFGDTLSTLMFAKRAKILKMKVEVNENATENFDSLRKEVKRLREELAQARYFKGDTQRTERPSFDQDFELTFEPVADSIFVEPPKHELIQTFEENELHYKALIEIYEEHMKNCESANPNIKKKNNMNMIGEWKNLEKRNIALTGLVKRFPAFTKIYKENLLLRQDKNNKLLEQQNQEEEKKEKKINESTITTIKECDSQSTPNYAVEEVIKHYEQIIDEMKDKFEHYLDNLEKNYHELEHECREKDKRLKEYIKKQDLPPDIEELKNENQYLHLNILNLENQIAKYQEDEDKHRHERRDNKKTPIRNSRITEKQIALQSDQAEPDYSFLLEKLIQIKNEANNEAEQAEQQRKQMLRVMDELRKQLNHALMENSRLQLKDSRCRSQRKTSREKKQTRVGSQTSMKKSLIEFTAPRQSESSRKDTIHFENQIKLIHEKHSIELLQLRDIVTIKEKEIVDLKTHLNGFLEFDRKIEDQFGRSLHQILGEYREMVKKQMNSTKSVRNMNIHNYKEQDPVSSRLEIKVQQKPQRPQKKVEKVESRVVKTKDAKAKRQQPMPTLPMPMSTKNVNSVIKKGYFTSK